jgi:hypothetical protein
LQEPCLRRKPRRGRDFRRASCAPLLHANLPRPVACCRILSHAGCAIGVCAGVCAAGRGCVGRRVTRRGNPPMNACELQPECPEGASRGRSIKPSPCHTWARSPAMITRESGVIR